MNEKLIVENTKLIHKVIKDMGLIYRTRDEYQDFYDSGLIGLINGAKTYNEGQTKKSTYLYKCIHNAIVNNLIENSMQKRNNKYGKDKSLFIKLKKDEWGEGFTILDTIKDEKVNIEEQIIREERAEYLYKAIEKLDPKEKDYIKKYYGVFGCTQVSGEVIAKEYNVSRQAVNTKIDRIRKKLRKHLEKIKEDL